MDRPKKKKRKYRTVQRCDRCGQPFETYSGKPDPICPECFTPADIELDDYCFYDE